MKDQELRKLARGLGRALKAKHYTIPHSVLLHAVAAIAGDTNWHVVVATGKGPETPDLQSSQSEVPVLKIGDSPLSSVTLRRMEAAEDIRVIVEVDLNTLLEGDLNEFLEDLAERITGSRAGLTDTCYQVVHSRSEGSLALQVLQNLSDWKADQLKAHGLDVLLDNAQSTLDRPASLPSGDLSLCVEVTAGTVLWESLSLDSENLATSGIPAECHSDDRVFEVSFDAAPWFARAQDKEIIALANCGFGGDYPADEVSMEMAGSNPELKELHNYVQRTQGTRRSCGYECHVDSDAALAWIKQHRPELLDQIEIED